MQQVFNFIFHRIGELLLTLDKLMLFPNVSILRFLLALTLLGTIISLITFFSTSFEFSPSVSSTGRKLAKIENKADKKAQRRYIGAHEDYYIPTHSKKHRKARALRDKQRSL